MGKKTGKGRRWRTIDLSGLIGFLSLVVTCAGVWVSVKTLHQTEYVHEETKRINQQMGRNELIRYARTSIEHYLDKEWFDKAVKMSNELNDTLRACGKEPDSTCYMFFMTLYQAQKIQKRDSAAEIAKWYLEQLR